MSGKSGALVAPPIAELGHRIEEWRRNRVHRSTAMPGELWAEAASLARRYGVYQVSRDLGLNYENLKRRAFSSSHEDRASGQTRFVEVPGVSASCSEASAGFEVEVSRLDGTFMRIRKGGDGLTKPGVPPALPGRHPKFDESGSKRGLSFREPPSTRKDVLTMKDYEKLIREHRRRIAC